MDVQTEKPQVKILTALIKILEIIAVYSLFGISAVIFTQILLRNLLSIGFPWADELSRFLHITLIFLTVPILYRERIIFKIDIFIERLPARVQNFVGAFTSFVCVAFSLVFLFSFVEFMSGSWDVPSPALQMPNLLFFFSVFFRNINVFVNFTGKINLRSRQESRRKYKMNGVEVVGLLLLLLALSVPLSVSMSIAGIAYIVFSGIPISVIAQRMGNAVNSFPLLAVPVFIFAGCLMNTSGITTRIFDFAKLLIGPIRGGLAQVNVLASLIFSGISGAALADIGGLGQIEIKAMEEQGYKSELAASITAASATIGPIFPPSIPLIIYGAVAEVSGVKLLIAGVVPGLLITFLLMLQIGYFARKYSFPAESGAYNIKEIFKAFRKAFPALLAPVILIGGLLSGLFSPTEVAAVTVFYGLILGKFIYRELTWKQLVEVGRQSIRQTANIMFIISSAAIFAFALTVEQVHVQMTDMLLGISKNPVILLLIVNVLLLVVGMIMETIAAILVLTPLLVPALSQAGIDPIHLGIVMVLNLMIGLLTPPVGMSLYMVSIVSEAPVEKLIRAILPYFLPLILSLIIVTLFPMISVWLPGLLF